MFVFSKCTNVQEQNVRRRPAEGGAEGQGGDWEMTHLPVYSFHVLVFSIVKSIIKILMKQSKKCPYNCNRVHDVPLPQSPG